MFTQYINPTLIEVMTPHCVECRAMKPDLDAAAGRFSDVVDLVVLDAAKEPDRVASMKVVGTPTLIAVKDGVEVARFTGRRSRSELDELFSAVAKGELNTISAVTRNDRLVWTTAGLLLLGAGLLSGPSWFLVVIGAGLTGYVLLRSLWR